MTEHIIIGIVSVIVLGIGAQWLAWRFKVPSILLLLIFGFLAGPVTGLLDPAALQGDWVFAFVSVSIGIILFEGGLSLQIDDLRDVGKAVRNLITVGVLVTWVLAGLAAYYLAGFSVPLSVLVGAILTVTGPTVVMPLLRHVRPAGRVGTVAKWEGITIDPVGAILAVLVLEVILLLNAAEGEVHGFYGVALHALEGLFLTIFISVGVSITGAALLIVILRRRLVPDFLQNSVALMIVVSTFALSNVLQEESGLLEVTLLGILMANQKYVPVRRIVEFKEDLRVLLLAGLFILLSARLEMDALQYIGTGSLLFLAVLMLVVRPAAVFLSTWGTSLTWKEKVFLSWLAPRGIVAAAVAALFSFSLAGIYPEEVDAIVPIVFLVIVGTVAVYGLTISPLARWLGLAQPNPQGVLFVGAHAWAQAMAQALVALGFKVLLVDSNPKNVFRARQSGLPAEHVNVLREGVIDDLDLGGIGRLLTLTPNDEVNALAALHFSEMFESSEIYQLAIRDESRRGKTGEIPQHLRGRPLFSNETTFALLAERFEEGAQVKAVRMTDQFGFEEFLEQHGETTLPLFLVRADGSLYVYTEDDNNPTPEVGQTLIALIDPAGQPVPVEEAPAA